MRLRLAGEARRTDLRRRSGTRNPRASEAFLVRLTDSIRELTDPVAIQSVAAQLLGEQLAADRVYYAEIDLPTRRALVHREYRRRPEAASLIGDYAFLSYPTIARTVLCGHEFVEPDVARSHRLHDEEKAAMANFEFASVVFAPLMKRGSISAQLVVTSAQPRRWTRTERAMIAETVERTWDAVERARAEAALRRAAEANAFRVSLSDALRALTLPEDVQAEAARRLGQFIRASRVAYAEIEADREHILSRPDYTDGVPSATGRYRIADFSAALRRQLEAGRPVIVNDTRTDDRISDTEREAYARLSIVSMMTVPFMKHGRFAAVLSVHQSTPRVWTEQEITLVRESAERTWVAVERARADMRRHEAEERYLALFNAIEQGFCTMELAFDEHDKPVDYRFLEVSPSFERQTGISNAAGRWMREIAPNQDAHWFATYGRVAKTGEAVRFENYSTPLNRWWSVYAFRIQDPNLRRIAVLFHDITDRKRAEEALERAHAELEARVEVRTRELETSRRQLEVELAERRAAEERTRTILAQLISVQENERRRIARDLHDNLGQRMTALHLKLEAMRRSVGDDHQEQIDDLQTYAQQIDKELRFFTWELRPASLYNLGLVPALEDYVRQWSTTYGVPAEFDAIGLNAERLPFEVETNLYRVAQEALNNVYKHANATQVDVMLQRLDNRVLLIVEDDGVGMKRDADDPSAPRGLGLVSMRERAELMGGSCTIESSLGGGTTIICSASLD
jgi:PAS domain S-box-containing protein